MIYHRPPRNFDYQHEFDTNHNYFNAKKDVHPTIDEIVYSILVNLGYSEFENPIGGHATNKGRLTFTNPDWSFSNLTDDMLESMNSTLFRGFSFEDPTLDKFFKKAFLYNFWGYRIAFQSFDSFTMRLSKEMMFHKDQIADIYNNIVDYLTGGHNQSANGARTGEDRYASQNTPQNEINLDLNDDTFNYADTNDIAKHSTDENKNTNDTDRGLMSLLQGLEIWHAVFKHMEKYLFLQVFE